MMCNIPVMSIVDRRPAEGHEIHLHHDIKEVGSPFLQSRVPVSTPPLLIAFDPGDDGPSNQEKEGA